jgi:RNA polymerase sigma-70 factor (ECF subfamily)
MNCANSSTRPAANICPAEDVPELVQACMAGDDVAKARFVTHYGELLRNAVARKLAVYANGRPVIGDVEDINSALLEKILSKNFALLGGLRDPLRLNGWLVSVTRNFVIDYLRKNVSAMRTHLAVAREEQDNYYPSPSEKLMAQESAALIRERVTALPAADRLVIELYYIHDMKYSEISEMTNQNINTIAARLRRAKTKLRKMFEESPELFDDGPL